MEKKVYTVEFEGMWAVPHGLVIVATSRSEAWEIAKKTITHTEVKLTDVNEYDRGVGVVFYESGDY